MPVVFVPLNTKFEPLSEIPLNVLPLPPSVPVAVVAYEPVLVTTAVLLRLAPVSTRPRLIAEGFE